MTETEITKYFKIAIKMAEKARGKCSPNPFVGSVIVKNGKIISTGWTLQYGSDHSEIQAIKKAGKEAKDAILFVTLEPCSHFGKTPPCAQAVINAGIKEVYIGIVDPNPKVCGKGIAMLKNAGVEVHYGYLEDKIKKQLEYYLCHIQKNKPFVTLKTALSLDGKYAAEDGSSQWITGEKARKYVHKLRSENDVVLTGINTILADDPLLNVRLPGNPKQPLRVVLDPFLKVTLESKWVNSLLEFPGMIITTGKMLNTPKAKELKKKGAYLQALKATDSHFNLQEVLCLLHKMNFYSVLLESGSGLAEAFLKERLIDKFCVIYGAKILGGTKSPFPKLELPNIDAAIPLRDIACRKAENDLIVTAYPDYETE